ncbi:MAG: SUMF1/EgtB/PvdO family nonheme iron enzyme [Pseudomonadota bacterium]
MKWGLLAVALALLPGVAGAQLLLPQPELRTLQDCETCPEMVTLPDGSLISRAPVQKQEFAAFVRATDYKHQGWGCKWRYAHIEQEPDHPAVCITFQAARQYAEWLSEKTGVTYRLPTGDELTYAVMGFSTANYWWGQQVGEGRANCDGCGSRFDGVGTSPVGTFEPNEFNLLDAVGNVWIWTTDCETAECQKRALLTGGWSSPPSDLRMTKRIFQAPDVPFNSYGFRVVREDG